MTSNQSNINSPIQASVIIDSQYNGQRLDVVASTLFDQYSRAMIQRWIRGSQLLLNDQPSTIKTKVYQGMIIDLHAETEVQQIWQAQDIPLDIVFEDEQILVINKPAGLVVHPAAGNPDGTLLNALLHHCPALSQVSRAGIVHRLDKETTGLLVVAKTLNSQTSLVRQMQQRSVKRIYMAIAQGHIGKAGTIDAPIGRHPVNRKKMAVLDKANDFQKSSGKAAITHYEPIQQFEHYSLIEVSLETGRTHQIRVHFSHIQHPLLGDPVYGGRPKNKAHQPDALQLAISGFNRQALHAKQLQFFHPSNNQLLTFSSPIANDMAQLIKLLDNH